MKTTILKRLITIVVFCCIFSNDSKAQCGTGYTRDTLNWDFLDFLVNSGSYVSPTVFLTLAQSQNQRFTFGTQTITSIHNYATVNVGGDVTSHTGELNSFGKGADVRFRGNGTITFSFEEAVQSLKFSIYDIDRAQTVTISAMNGVATTNVSLATLTGSILSLTNNNTPSARATATNATVLLTANEPSSNGTLNVTVTGPVTTFTITVTTTGTDTNDDGSFFISDISACSAGTFPDDYYSFVKPFTGQPAYYLSVINNTIYYIDVSTGIARFLFRDNGHTNINSLAYDPYNRMVYYSYSLTSNPVNERAIRRYDYNMDTMGIFIQDVNSVGIPTFESGVESGAGAFYNGHYYLGVEATNAGDDATSRESIMWRINLTPTFGVSSIAQVFSLLTDDGAGTNLHDWGDVGINDGIMYNFDGALGQTDFYHKNLLTGECIRYAPAPSSLIPRQVSVDWTGQMYNSGPLATGSALYVTPYIGNGAVNNALQFNITYQGVPLTGSLGDAAEAFKPKTDFGDAPATYDPATTDPGTHERNDSIYLGSLQPGIEWAKKTSANATGDGTEEDAVPGIVLLSTGTSNFTVSVKAMNRTGRQAVIAGWIDADGDGVYEVSEGTVLTIPSADTVQTVTLLWSGLTTPLLAFDTTFLRLRITTIDQGLTTSRPNGYLDNGEIEDHRVEVTNLLPAPKMTFNAQIIQDDKVKLVWNLNQEIYNVSYQVQKSEDGFNWQTMANKISNNSIAPVAYTEVDPSPFLPTTFYRIQTLKSSGLIELSETRKVDFSKENSIAIFPNPTNASSILTINAKKAGDATVEMIDGIGRTIFRKAVRITAGLNRLDLHSNRYVKGLYRVSVKMDQEVIVKTLVVLN